MAAAQEIEELPLDLPVTCLGYGTISKLCGALTVESANRKMDWRALGGILGFNFSQIQLMQQDRQSCKGELLIRMWEETGSASVRRMIYALKEAKMGEGLNIIRQDPTLNGMS